jgi:hypothetical protein
MSGPYAFINDKHQHYSTIKLSLHLSPDAAFKFDTVNIHLRDQWVTPGQIVIIPDTHSISCTAQEARMMEAARVFSRAFGHNGEDVGTLVVQNYDLLQSLLGYSGLLIDSAGGSWARHLDGVINTLNEINRDHKLYLRRGTPIARVEFLNRRQVLFQTLDTQLPAWLVMALVCVTEVPSKKCSAFQPAATCTTARSKAMRRKSTGCPALRSF